MLGKADHLLVKFSYNGEEHLMCFSIHFTNEWVIVCNKIGASQINLVIGIQEFRDLGYRLRYGELHQKLKLRGKK